MKLVKAGMVVVSLFTLAGCSSSNSSVGDNDELVAGDLDGDENLTDNESSPSLDGTVAFPELQGMWSEDCDFYDPAEPEEGYTISTFTVTGNIFKTNTTIYSDSNCVTLLERGFLQAGSSAQTNGVLTRPGGSANTSVGAVPFIDITTQEYTIDGKPVIASLAAFFPVETDYEIVYVDGGTFYLGVVSQALDGSSPETRPTALDFQRPFTRQ